MLSTDQKGSIAETAIIHEAVKLGIDVYKPISDGTRCDLILDIDGRLTRVQCKWAARHGDVLVIRCYRCRRTRSGLLKRGYTADEVDAFAAYCVELGKCYFFRFEDWGGHTAIQLRLRPSKNKPAERNQLGRGVRVRRYTGGRTGGRSSAGRAPAWHAGGHGFEPRRLHLKAAGNSGFFLFHIGGGEFGFR